jgi:hypothetical protein
MAAMSDSVGDHELSDTYFMHFLAERSPGMPWHRAMKSLIFSTFVSGGIP